MQFFDSHTHATFAAFEKDSKEVIDRALATGVWIVNVGTQKDTSKRAVEVAREYNEGVYAAVGIHPVHTSKSYHDEDELGGGEAARAFTSRGEEFNHEYYLELARDPKVVAIGECGLDYYRLEQRANSKEQIERQKEVFIKHIELAHEVRKPLMIHCRSAFPNLVETLKAYRLKLNAHAPGIVHFFSGTISDAKKLLDMGFSFTFGGVITFAREYDEVIKMLPLERIFSETDAPYVAPAPHRGKRNEPAYVVEVVKKLAELKGVSVEEMAGITFENAKRVFRL
ncbi:MAG: TatD family hydrolase [Candidatus Liptonbacteria bacterium]|nr:TatD family hydrolase [Candidatus Liptonbacteria bacterium]